MINSPSAVVGGWYKTLEGEPFKVVAIDEDEQNIDIQYYSGEIDELDYDTWDDLELRAVAPPEDWSGPFDDLERDDLGFTDMNARPEGHQLSLDEIERED